MRQLRADNQRKVLFFLLGIGIFIGGFVSSSPANDAVIGVSKEISPGQIYEEACYEIPNVATVTLDLEGICPRGKPADIMLVIDISSTMLNDSRIDSARSAAKAFVDLMRDVDWAGLVAFGDNATLELGLTAMDGAGKTLLKGAIDGLLVGGFTNIGDAIRVANHEIADIGRGGDTLGVQILLSDGLPNRPLGLPNPPGPQGYAIMAADSARMLGIQIETIGLALESFPFGIQLLQDIADTTGGHYHDSPTPDSLRSIFINIAQPEDCNPLTNITITDVLQPHIHFEGNSSIAPNAIIPNSEDGTTRLVWALATLDVEETWTVSFDVSSEMVGTNILSNVTESSKVSYSTNGSIRDTLFPVVTLNVDPCPLPFIEVTKTDEDVNGDILEPGDALLYTIVLSNTGTLDQGDNDGNEFEDVLPAHTIYDGTYVPTASSGVVSYNAGMNRIDWNGTVPAGGSVTITFRVLLDSPLDNGTIISNQGTAYWDSDGNEVNDAEEPSDDPDTPEDDDPTEAEVVSAPLLNITKTSSPDPVEAGGTLTYTITVENVGNAAATGVTVVDNYDESKFMVTDADGGAVGGGQIVWDGGLVIPAGGKLEFTVIGEVASPLPDGTEIGNAVSVVHDGGEVPPVEIRTEVESAPELVITKVDAPDPVEAGGTLTYTIRVENVGNADATGVTVTDDYDESVFSVTDPDGGVVGSGEIVWDGGLVIPAGGFLEFTVVGDVASPLADGTTFDNTVSVTYSEGTVPPETISTEVESAPALVITKEDDPDPVDAGGVLTYTITIENTGNADATGVTVTDDYDESVFSVTDPDGGVVGSGEIVWDGGLTIPAGGSISFTVVGDVAWPLENGTTFDNTVSLTYNEGTVPPETINTTVTSAPIITATKTDIDVNGGDLEPGDDLDYKVTIKNTGNEKAEGLTYIDEIPAHTHDLSFAFGVLPDLGTTNESTPEEVIISGITVNVEDSVIIVFRVTVDDTVGADVDEISNQGVVTNIPRAEDELTDDPDVPGAHDPTVTPLVASAFIEAYMEVEVVGGGDLVPGGLLRYTITIVNIGNRGAANLDYTNPIPEYTSYVDGSLVASAGTLTAGDPIRVVGFYSQPGVDIEIAYEVVVDSQVPAGVDEIVNQGLVENVPNPGTEPTDYPVTPDDDDPTIVPLMAAPLIEVTKVDVDVNGGLFVQGDVLQYVVTITNDGNQHAGDLTFLDQRPEHTHSLTILSYPPDASDAFSGPDEVIISGIDVAAGDFVTIVFQVTLDDVIPVGVMEIANQGFVENIVSDDAGPVDEPTDDPATPLRDDDPTITPIGAHIFCIDYTDGTPEDFLMGDPRDPDPSNDLYAVGFYNPFAAARLVSVAFQWYDPGSVVLRVYLGSEETCPECGSLAPGVNPLGDLIREIGGGDFVGNWQWEEVDIEECVIIPPKRCFYLVWQIQSSGKPRILGDAGHTESHSWYYNFERGEWKCFPGYEYMARVCLDYMPDCVEIREPDITWSHPYRDGYPCVCDDYTVEAVFHNDCPEDRSLSVSFFEAPWGLFMAPPIGMGAYCIKDVAVPGRGSGTAVCECEYHHDPDLHNWWARNIVVAWSGKEWDEVGEFCLGDVTRFARRCRMTIWPDGPWDKEPVRWGLAPITIPVHNEHTEEMRFELSVVDLPDYWRAFLSWTQGTLSPAETRNVYLTVFPDGPEPTEPVVLTVKAFKCNGEWGEVEIEFMPYPKHFYLGPDDRPVQPVHVERLQWSPRYPCENMPYDVWVTVVNDGPNSAYPKISFGLAEWGFFFPSIEGSVYDTVLWGGIGGFARQVVAPYHYQTPWFVYEDLECNYYQQYARNIVIDYPVIRRHCPDPDFESWWTAEDSTTEYLRDCERWLWPKHRWVGAEHPWASVVFPIPVYNGEPYPDNIDLWIDEGAFPPHIPPGWGYSFDVDAFNLLPGEEAVANLTIVPKGSGPPLDLPAHVVVQAAKGFCKRDTDYVDIKFMPYTGMCIRDTSGIKVMYKYSESCGGRDPSLVPGDRVNVGLMLDNEYPVSAVQIDLGYDAEYLRVVDVQTTARTTGFELVHRELAPGTHEIALYSTPSHPDIDISPQRVHCELPPGYEHVGLLSIVSVTFEVLPGAPAGTCADIWYGTVILDGLPDWGGHPKEPLCLKYEDKGQICFGGYLVPVKCDVTGRGGLPDTMVTLTDLYAILNHMLGNEPQLSGSVTQPGTQRWAADASGDQLINIIDLMKCINRAVGVCDPKVIVADVEVEEVVGLTGRTVALPVRVSSEVDVAGMLLRLSYDRGALLAGEPMLMDRASGMDLVYGHVGGELVLLISDLTGEVIEAGGGPILRIPFEVSERVAQETLIEMAEPIVFTTDERIVFGASSIFAVRVEALVPAEYSLAQNYPNPFNPTTDIQFQIADNGSPVQTTLKIYNILGQEVRTLVNEEKEPGYYTLTWDGRNEEGNEVPSGVYFYSMEAGDFQATKRMVLMK